MTVVITLLLAGAALEDLEQALNHARRGSNTSVTVSIERQREAMLHPPLIPQRGEPTWPLPRFAGREGLGTKDRTEMTVEGPDVFVIRDARGDLPGPRVAIVMAAAPTHAWCSGALVANSLVLTAAHCFRYKDAQGNLRQLKAEDLVVVSGALDLAKKATRSSISETYFPSSYRPEVYADDVGLLKLAKPMQIGVLTLGWPSTDVGDVDPELCGWGANGQAVGTLACSPMTIVDLVSCHEIYGSLLTAHMICTSGVDDPCPGDSGAPLTANRGGRLVVIGVVSWGWSANGFRCHTPRTRDTYYPGVSTSLTGVLGHWVSEVMLSQAN